MNNYKFKLPYTVRTTRAPGETRDTLVPVIVDRLQPTELATIIENCIDRSLIAGLKPTAAQGIADGIAAQMAFEFSKGRGIKFGDYFYGRPYLQGTVDGNGRLNSTNSITVRLYKGNSFKLSTDDFTMEFDGAGDAVKVDFIMGDTSDAGGNTRGTVVTGAPVVIQGRNLYAAGDTNKVYFSEVDGEDEVEVDTFTSQGDGILVFAWPSGLVAGKSYNVTVQRTDVNGVSRVATGKTVTVVAGSTPPGPTPTGPTVTAINSGTFLEGGGTVVHGENMRFEDQYPGNHVVIKDSEGTDMGAMISTDESIPVTEESFGLTIDAGTPFTEGDEYTFEFSMVDADGQPVTVSQTARYVSE